MEKSEGYERDLLQSIAEGDSWAKLPFNAQAPVLLPQPPLLDLVAGRSDLDPNQGIASMLTQAHGLFSNYQIDAPFSLALGSFDFAFVVLYLLPLMLIALNYSLLSEERELGQDRVLLVNGVSLRRLLAGRILARSALVLIPLVLSAVIVLLLGNHSGDHLQRFALFIPLMLVMLGYAAFWLALCAWFNTFRLNGGQTLLLLTASWIIFVLVIPAIVGAASRGLHPPPSRFEQIAAARQAQIGGVQRSEALIGQYMHDHPDLGGVADSDAPAWVNSGFVVARTVDEAVNPVAQRFDQALHQQQSLVSRWQYLTPALLAQRSFITLAGTGEARQQDFQRQAKRFLGKFREETGRMSLGGLSLNAERIDALPRFTFIDTSQRSMVSMLAMPLLALWALALLILVSAFRRIGRENAG